MSRIATPSIIAFVANENAVWYLSDGKIPCHAVSSLDFFSTREKLAISVSRTTQPRPTAVWATGFINVPPEANFQRYPTQNWYGGFCFHNQIITHLNILRSKMFYYIN